MAKTSINNFNEKIGICLLNHPSIHTQIELCTKLGVNKSTFSAWKSSSMDSNNRTACIPSRYVKDLARICHEANVQLIDDQNLSSTLLEVETWFKKACHYSEYFIQAAAANDQFVIEGRIDKLDVTDLMDKIKSGEIHKCNMEIILVGTFFPAVLLCPV